MTWRAVYSRLWDERSREVIRFLVYFLILAICVGGYMLFAWLMGDYSSSRTFDQTSTMVGANT